MKVYFSYVRGYADKNIPYKHLMLAQQLNVEADRISQPTLMPSLTVGCCINGQHFPFETVRVINKSTKEKSILK